MKPSSGESAPEASMSRSDTSRGVSVTVSRASRSSGRSPVRSTSVPPCGAIRPPSRRRRLTPRTSTSTRPSFASLATMSAALSSGECALGVEHDLGLGRFLVGVRHARELLDLALERLLVKALHVARARTPRPTPSHTPRRTSPNLLDHLARHALASPRTARSPTAMTRRPAASAARRPSRHARCACRGPPSRSRAPSTGAWRTVSPSRYSTTRPRRSSSGPTRSAIVVLPRRTGR